MPERNERVELCDSLRGLSKCELVTGRLTWLPVVEDTEEAPHVYGLLCELAAGGHAALQTPDAPQRVIATLAEAFLRDAVPNDNPVYAQMVALVRQIQVTHARILQTVPTRPWYYGSAVCQSVRPSQGCIL